MGGQQSRGMGGLTEVSGTAVWGGGRCEGGQAVRVRLREVGGCQRLVKHLGMEQKTVAFQHSPY